MSAAPPALLPFVALCLLTPPALGAEWQLSKGVGIGATRTDNADLVTGDERRSESVLALSPFVRLATRGRRSELALQGAFELRRFVDENRTEFDPDLSLVASTAFLERALTFDTAARVSQRSASGGATLDGEAVRIDDTAEVYEIALGPSLGGTLGSRTRYDLGYRFATVRSSDDTQNGSDTQTVSSATATSFGNAGPSLLLDAAYTHARFEGGGSARNGSASLGIAGRLRPTLVGYARVGRDLIRSGESEPALEGAVWDVGMRWQPGERLLATVGYGESSYGSRPLASLRLGGRRSSIELSWSRQLGLGGGSATDALSLATEVGRTPAGEGGAAPLDDPTDPLVTEPLATFASNASSVDERVALRYEIRGARSTLSAALSWFEREELAVGAAEGSVTAREGALGLGLRRTLSRRVEAKASLTVSDRLVPEERDYARENRIAFGIKVAL